MAKRKKLTKSPRKTLDIVSAKRRRGRPGVRRSFVTGSAYDYGLVLEQHWDQLGLALLNVQTSEDVISAFDNVPEYVKNRFVPDRADEILRLLRDPKFPKKREAQIRFLGESLAGRGIVSPRRARDICAEERAKPKHQIIRRDFYIQCTCGYKGPAKHGACPKCGTKTVAWSVQFRGLFPKE
mgnify:CR=1 FL=1